MKHHIRTLSLFLFISFAFSQTQLGSDIDGEAAGDYFGTSVSMNSAGDRIAIGADYNDGTASDAGHVRVYEYSNSSWTQLGSDIDGEAASDGSGGSVSMNSAGDRVAIGAIWNDGTGTQAGHVQVYEYSNSSWTQIGSDIDGEAAQDHSGVVSMNSAGDRVAIGAWGNDGTAGMAGHVRVYEYSNSSWTQIGSDIDGEAMYDYSGGSVSMNSAGDRVAIGANENDGTASDAGHVRVYEYSNSSWTQVGSDIDGEAAGDYSGRSVSINSAGDRVAIGAHGNDGTGDNAGHVRIYEYSSSSWTQVGSDIDGEAAGDYSGISVSMNSAGDRVAIGAHGNDGTSNNAGHVRVYEYSNSSWTQLNTDINGEAASNYSGWSVSMNSAGDRVAIGAYGNDGTGNDAGHVRVYSVSTFGCTDPYADNYDSTATIDDGSCSGYPDNGEYSLSFDGIDYVEVPDGNPLDITGEITLEAWVNLETSGQNEFRTILSKGYGPTNNYRLAVDWYNKVDFGYYGGNNAWNEWHTGANTISYDEWNHIAVTHIEGSDPVFYVNGSEVAADNYYGTDTSNMVMNNYSLYIGQHNESVPNVYPFIGLIDEVAVWNNSLSQSQIQNSLFTGLSGDELGLVGYWKFNEGADTTTYDHSGNANHGDINGASWAVSLTYVPDDNFEQALIDLGYDDVLDNYVVTDSINSVTVLPVSSSSISDLTGIEDFIALESLNCSYNQLTSLTLSSVAPMTGYLLCTANQLTSLDVSNYPDLNHLNVEQNLLTALDVSSNTALTNLNCYYNQLDSLDVSSNTALTNLHCGYNQLDSLDVSANRALTELRCQNNQLTSLDVSDHTALTHLLCNNNQLDSLDVSSNTALTYFRCDANQLTSLDISNNTALTGLECFNNQLTSLDVSNNTTLTHLKTQTNQLTSLDVSNNTMLTDLRCYNNELTYLNMKNGVTDALTTFNATNNDSLECIETLDPDYATENWTYDNDNIDEGVTFSVLCESTDLSNWYVDTTGSDGQGTGTAESPFASIQTGINAAGGGDTVHVAAGTYIENIYIDKNIAVLGEDRETTIIDGDSSGSVVTFSNIVNDTALFSEFTITNGSGLMEDDPSNNWDNGLSKGGGIYLDECSPILEQLIIENNTVSGGGGGISKSSQNSSLHISHSIVRNNTAKYAGAIHGQNGSNEITDCQIYNNHATNIGGGFGGVMTVSNSSIYNNTAVNGAAAMSADATMFNCVVSGNESPNYCIEIGGGSTEIKNTIIWGNTSSAIQCWSAITISYSDIEGGQEAFLDDGTDPSWGEGNIDADPLFCEPDSGNYTLMANSPCVGTGENGANMGAFGVGCGPSFAGPIWHVSQDGSDTTGNGSVELPFSTIQHAIALVDTGDTIIVHPGTYVENVDFGGKSIVLGSNWLFANDTTAVDSTIIDGNHSGPVVNISNGEDSTTALIGFTLKNGSGAVIGNYNKGGGLYIEGSRPSIRWVNIVDCAADGGWGGGVYISESDVSLIRTNISRNHAQWGGGIAAENSHLVLRFTTLIDDSASISGGGVHLNNVDLNARRFNGFNNVATLNGGGLFATGGSDVFIRRLMLNGNRAYLGGAFSFNDSSTIDLNNGNINLNNAEDGGGIWASAISGRIGAVSFQNNTAEDLGGAMHLSSNSDLEATDMVVINNSANRGGGVSILNSVGDFVGGEINNNYAWRGGGIFSSRSDLDFFSITVTQNNSEDIGGGLLSISTNLVMDSTNVTFNSSDSSSGGGIMCINYDSTSTYDVVITNSFISRNNANNSAAGLYFRTAFDDSSGMDILIENTRIIRNDGDYYTGLRIYGLNTQFEVNNCIFRGNNAVEYVAAAGFSGSCVGSVNHSLFAFNHASTAGGNFNSGGASVWSGADVDFDHCTFANNTAAYGTALTVGAASAAVTNSIIWGNPTSNHVALDVWDGTGGTLDISYTDLIGGSQAIQLEDTELCSFSWGDGNINEDPLFCLPDSGNYALAENSPCVEAAEDRSDLGAFGIGCDPIILSTAGELLPVAYALHQNYPNPFNPVTTIQYDLPENSQVQVAIYDMLGRKVRTLVSGFENAGFKAVQWQGRNDFGRSVGAGVYIYQIQAGDFLQTRKMILLK